MRFEKIKPLHISQLSVAFVFLMLGTALKADQWAPLPKKIVSTTHQYGEFSLVYEVDAIVDQYYPERTVTLYHKDVVKGHYGDIKLGTIAASPDHSHFVILSNSGPDNMAFYIIDSKGNIIKKSTHRQIDRRIYDMWSISLIRSWHLKSPNVKFEFEGKRLAHLYVPGSKYRRLDLMADNLGIDFEKDNHELLTTKALVDICKESRDVRLIETRVTELLKQQDGPITPELNTEVSLLIPTLLEFHMDAKTTDSAAGLLQQLAESKFSCSSKAWDILSGIAGNEMAARIALDNLGIVDHKMAKESWPQSMNQLKAGGHLTDERLISSFKNEAADPQPYCGYYFKFLKTKNAAEDFGILAFPANYGTSGRRLIFHCAQGTYYLESKGLEKNISANSDIEKGKWDKRWSLWQQ